MRALIITNSITRRDEQSLNSYLNEISKFSVLSPEEEHSLFQRIKIGDKKAFTQIVNHNLRFVVSVAKQYQNLGMWLGDLVNEGNLGLIKAAKRFDETRGFKFISYAVWWIRQSILQALNVKGRNIRLPLNLVGNMSKVNSAIISFLQHNERMPTNDELVTETDLSRKVIDKCVKHYKRVRSLDAPLNDDSNATMATLMVDSNTPSPSKKLEKESLKTEVKTLLNSLSERQNMVLKMYFGIGRKHPLSLEDISQYMGLTRERVRQIKDKGIRSLRQKTKQHQMTFTLN
ncbi:MAG: RNA polymerase sigma factor RpoD/SigA [Saprospiraceae bacterium]